LEVTLEVAVLALLSVLAGIGFSVLRRPDLGAMAFWTSACVALFGAAICNTLLSIGDAAWILPISHALRTAYPAMLLAGAVAYAGHRVPRWLIPAALGLGGVEGLAVLVGHPELGRGIGLALEPTASLGAAFYVSRAARGPDASASQRALAPVMVGIAVLAVVTLLGSVPGAAISIGFVGGWAVVVPILLAVQIAAVGDRVQETLRSSQEELERRVEERTAELRESEERYRIVSELSSDYSFSLSIRSGRSVRIEWATDALFRITGYTPEELEGIGWDSILHADDVEPALGELDAVLAGSARSMDVRIITKSGEVRWLSTHARIRRSPVDGSLGIVGAARDITERKETEQERRRLDHHMQEAQRLESLGVLAGAIAHDFNNILTVILGSSRLALAELESNPPVRKRVSRINAAAKYAAGLTRQMLTYSGKASLRPTPLDLSQMTRDMLDLLRASVKAKGSLEVELAEDLPAVEADATQIRQVLLNLVSNASDALGEEGGAIRVRTAAVRMGSRDLGDSFGTPDPAPGEYVSLEVSDTGVGIDGELKTRVFEPFYTTKVSAGDSGRGLGLAAVLGIVRAHRAVISIDSEPGAGTTFRVLIPLSSRIAEPLAEVRERSADAARRYTVLVVDDDEGVLEVTGESLERLGFDVVTALGGHEGIDLLRARSGEIDAVVLDLVMPEVNGEEALLEMRRIRPDVPVILVTGYDKARTGDRLPVRGVAGYVYKPYEPEELAEQLQRALAS
jgi:PAS domain S-box-containing protein